MKIKTDFDEVLYQEEIDCLLTRLDGNKTINYLKNKCISLKWYFIKHIWRRKIIIITKNKIYKLGFDGIKKEQPEPMITRFTDKLVVATTNDLDRLAVQAQNDEKLSHNIRTRIHNTSFNYLSPDKYVLQSTLYQILSFIIKNETGFSYFIENCENKIIAFISYLEDDNDPSIINSVIVINFYMVENNCDIFSATHRFIDELFRNHKEVNFSASVYNEKAVKNYDIYLEKNHGGIKNRVQDGNMIYWKIIQEPVEIITDFDGIGEVCDNGG